MKKAKGGELFHDRYGSEYDAYYDRHRQYIANLRVWRNKLLHEGSSAIPAGEAAQVVIAVLGAIDWLFEGTASVP